MNVTAVIALLPGDPGCCHLPRGSASRLPPIPSISCQVPLLIRRLTWDLLINVSCELWTGGPGGNGGLSCVSVNTFPYLGAPVSAKYFPVGSSDGEDYSEFTSYSVLINRLQAVPRHPSPGDTLYIQLQQSFSGGHLLHSPPPTLRSCPCRSVWCTATLCWLVSGASTAGVSLLLVSGGVWSTSVSLFSAVSSLNATVLPAHYLLVRLANQYNVTSSFLNPNAPSSSTVSRMAMKEQMLTINDVCTLPICIWTFAVYSVTNDSFAFALSAPTTPQRVVPGIISTPQYAATASMSYWTFSLPHPTMTATVTLQSLILGAYVGSTTNVDLFVSTVYVYPDLRTSTTAQSSTTDTVYGTDVVPIAPPTTGPLSQRVVNMTYYVAVFGQRAGYYTLLVQATDPGQTPQFITNNQPASDSVAPLQSNYYQYNMGQVASTTDLSLILSSNATLALQPSLYATFSYTHPGPISGYLPSFLPYEMFSTTPNANGVQQVTLQSKLSSSNVLPLQSQSSLYVAVYGGNSGAQPIQYQLSVSLSTRIALTPPTSLSFTQVQGGSVQYFTYSFSQLRQTGLQALLVVTGLTSSPALLPSVYTTSPSISAQVDPVISIPTSYTSSMTAPTTGTSSSFNALQSIISADCSAFPTSSTCQYKSMVYSAQSMPSYAIAITTYAEGDQQLLNTSTLQSVSAGAFAFYYFTLTADILNFTLTLTTNTQDGNADMFISTHAVNTHPSMADSGSNTQWTATADPALTGTYTEQVQVMASDTRWVVGSYYVSVFGQRAATYQLTLHTTSNTTQHDTTPPTPHTDQSSTANGEGATSDLQVALAVTLPIIAVLLVLFIALLYAYFKLRASKDGTGGRPSFNGRSAESSVHSQDAQWDGAGKDSPSVQMTPRTLAGRRPASDQRRLHEEEKQSDSWEMTSSS